MTATTQTDHYPTRGSSSPQVMERHDPVVWGERDGPLSSDTLADYRHDGFLSFESLVSSAEAAQLLEEAHRIARDPSRLSDERTIIEPDGTEVRSVFEVHSISEMFAKIVADDRLAGIARQVLGSDVYIHQSRINLKPGFTGKEFDWHSDFETWHAEDGMPAMRAVSISLALTANYPFNGALMIIPGSHRKFVPCAGETPEDHFRSSLKRQEVGIPDRGTIAELAAASGIDQLTGAAGSAVAFDSNCLHGSNSNITPFPRSNLFVVYNSVDNALTEPFAAPARRPEFIASREPTLV